MVSPENGNEGDVQGAQQIVQEGPAQQREATPASNEGASTRSRRSSKKSSAAAVGGVKQEGEVAEAPAAIGTPVNPETGTTTAAPAVAEERSGVVVAPDSCIAVSIPGRSTVVKTMAPRLALRTIRIRFRGCGWSPGGGCRYPGATVNACASPRFQFLINHNPRIMIFDSPAQTI